MEVIRCVSLPRFVIRIVATAPFPNMGSPLRSTGTPTDTPSKNWIVRRGEGLLVHALPTATKQMEATATRQPDDSCARDVRGETRSSREPVLKIGRAHV